MAGAWFAHSVGKGKSLTKAAWQALGLLTQSAKTLNSGLTWQALNKPEVVDFLSSVLENIIQSFIIIVDVILIFLFGFVSKNNPHPVSV